MARPLLPEEIDRMLEQCETGRLGLSRDGIPYVVPLSYWFSENTIYFHGAPRGRKIDYILANARACFLVDRMDELIKSDHPCRFNLNFQSAMAEGEVALVEDEAEKLAALQGLSAKYGGPEVAALLAAGDIQNVAVFKLSIKSKSGRANPSQS
ncbi:MAG: pyridoxamine 5'-phosphate oxidase family protein [Bacillota bacterium]